MFTWFVIARSAKRDVAIQLNKRNNMQNENETPIEQVQITDDAGASVPDELAIMTDKYLRMAAELENTRRRASIDAAATARNRAMSVAASFLPLVDAIIAAQKLNPDDTGIGSMVRAMESVLSQIGITKIETIGQPLNPAVHNAIQVMESDATPNTVIDEMQSGYMFGDAILRPAMVVVSK